MLYNIIFTGTRYAKPTKCDGFLCHKQLTCSVSRLLERQVDVYTVTQHRGEYVNVPPSIIHSGYNAVDNTAEAVNFGFDDHFTEVGDSDGYTFTTCKSGRRLGKAVTECQEGYDSHVP